MSTTPSAFNNFAPAILNIYRRDKEAFWAAVMAPFLANSVSLLDWWQQLKVDAGLRLNRFFRKEFHLP